MGKQRKRELQKNLNSGNLVKFKKLYYKIGEISEITGLAHHVIRFWEKEFPQLSPRKTPTGHRIYSEKDLETILLIKKLLYEKKFTISGAREYLSSLKEEKKEYEHSNNDHLKLLKRVVFELKRIKEILNKEP